MSNQNSKASKRYEIVDGAWAITDSAKLKLNDPLSSRLFVIILGYHEFFEVNFDNVFYSNLNGTIHSTVLDFGFKPSILIGYQMWYDFCIPDCHSFKEFIDYLSLSRLV